MAQVRIPSALEGLTNGSKQVEAQGATLSQVIDALEEAYPGIKERLLDESGELRRFINIYVNEEDVRFLDGLSTGLTSDDQISIIPAVAGG
ncbi:MAG: MoaD/ThiS family protein [Actinobacteria bacterium]|nr:MAG: MoaD/ThiS family protein [Actinomycetota bacterium]